MIAGNGGHTMMVVGNLQLHYYSGGTEMPHCWVIAGQKNITWEVSMLLSGHIYSTYRPHEVIGDRIDLDHEESPKDLAKIILACYKPAAQELLGYD